MMSPVQAAGRRGRGGAIEGGHGRRGADGRSAAAAPAPRSRAGPGQRRMRSSAPQKRAARRRSSPAPGPRIRFGWKALRGSMGSAFRLPVASTQSLDETIHAARAAGLRIFATVPRGGTLLARAALARPCVILLGGEGPGLQEDLLVNRRRGPDHTDAAAGRVTQRRDRGRAHPLRSITPEARCRCSMIDDVPARKADDEHPDAADRPLAERMRPRTLDEFVGQQSLVAPGRPLRRAIEQDRLQSIILWGPPGTGKTTLARLIATATQAHFIAFSAVLSGIKEIRAVMAEAEEARRRPAGARSSSSTRSTASTRRSRTPSSPASKPATSSSSARRPRTRRSR